MTSLQHLTRQDDPSDIWAALDKQGGVIIDGFLDEALLSKLREDPMPGDSDVH